MSGGSFINAPGSLISWESVIADLEATLWSSPIHTPARTPAATVSGSVRSLAMRRSWSVTSAFIG